VISKDSTFEQNTQRSDRIENKNIDEMIEGHDDVQADNKFVA
jgi:hypothetical protein